MTDLEISDYPTGALLVWQAGLKKRMLDSFRDWHAPSAARLLMLVEKELDRRGYLDHLISTRVDI